MALFSTHGKYWHQLIKQAPYLSDYLIAIFTKKPTREHNQSFFCHPTNWIEWRAPLEVCSTIESVENVLFSSRDYQIDKSVPHFTLLKIVSKHLSKLLRVLLENVVSRPLKEFFLRTSAKFTKDLQAFFSNFLHRKSFRFMV